MKIHIIYLEHNEFSTRIANSCIAQARKFGLDPIPFGGFTGDQAQQLFDLDGVKVFPRKLKRLTAGIRGCAASHYALWKKCMADEQPYIILEQDAYMIRPLPEPALEVQHVCKLDYQNPFANDYNQQVGADLGSDIIDYDLGWGFKKHAAPYGGYFRGAWAYVIMPEAAKLCVQGFQTQGWVPADKQFGCDLLNLKTTASTVFRIHPEYTASNIEALSLTRNLK